MRGADNEGLYFLLFFLSIFLSLSSSSSSTGCILVVGLRMKLVFPVAENACYLMKRELFNYYFSAFEKNFKSTNRKKIKQRQNVIIV